jgi:uncharacterized membrane protein YhaH (DUF805 family)
MGNLLFPPNGRIGPQDFLKGLGIITVLSALITMVPAFNFNLGTMLGYASLILLFPMFCLLIKRSHDGGKSGWMSIVWFILILIIGGIIQYFAGEMTGGAPLAEMKELTKAAAEEGDFGALVEISKEYAPQVAQKTAIPSAIAGFIGTMLGGFLINLIVKQDPHENQFGNIPA